MFPVSRTTQPHPNSSQARSRDEAPRSSVPGPRPEWAGTHTVQSSWPETHWYTIDKYPFDCKITNTCHSWQGNPGFHLGSHWRGRSDTCVSSPPQQWAPESYSRKPLNNRPELSSSRDVMVHWCHSHDEVPGQKFRGTIVPRHHQEGLRSPRHPHTTKLVEPGSWTTIQLEGYLRDGLTTSVHDIYINTLWPRKQYIGQ